MSLSTFVIFSPSILGCEMVNISYIFMVALVTLISSFPLSFKFCLLFLPFLLELFTEMSLLNDQRNLK